MAHNVFISYSSIDKDAAEAVRSILEENGISCWMAPRNITPGLSFAEAIIDGIKSSKVFVLVYSSNSNNSSQVIKEVDRAVHHKLAIIPLRLEDVPMSKQLEYYVSDVHWLDALTPPLEKHIDKLCEVVKMLLTLETIDNNDIREALGTETIKQAESVKHTGKFKIFKSLISTVVPVVIVTAILIGTVLLLYPKIFKKNDLDRIRSADGRISVAVMPFQNMTNDTTWNVWQDGIQDNLITSLSNSEELQIKQTESINSVIKGEGLTNYASITPPIASSISRKLDANVFISGNIIQEGATIRLNAQLVNSKTKETFKSFQIDGTKDNILHIIDSLSTIVKNFLVIRSLQENSSARRNIPLNSDLPTYSPEAYMAFIQGNKLFFNLDYRAAMKSLREAIALDSNFVQAIILLACAYGNEGMNDQAIKWCLKAKEKRDRATLLGKIYIDWFYAGYFESPHEQIIYVKQHLEYDDQAPGWIYQLGSAYFILHQYDKAIPELEKSLDIYRKWGIRPLWSPSYISLGDSYNKTGQYKKTRKLYEKAELDFPDDPRIPYNQAVLSLIERDTVSANEYIGGLISKAKALSRPESLIIFRQGQIYQEAGTLVNNNTGLFDKAENYFRQALTMEPENPEYLYWLAMLLIDADRNVSEGLELVDKAVKLRPANINYLHWKGWGLYKQGKYKEALEILKKAWDLPGYDHDLYLHLETAKKTVAGQK